MNFLPTAKQKSDSDLVGILQHLKLVSNFIEIRKMMRKEANQKLKIKGVKNMKPKEE